MSKKEEEQELSFGQRFELLNKPKKEVTIGDFTEKPAPKTRRERFDDKFVRGERGKLLRRGTAPAQRAEIKEKNRNRAKQAALKRRNK